MVRYRWLPLLLAAVLAAALAACDGATEPTEEVVLLIAHAAPGAGSFALSVDGEQVAPALASGDVVEHVFRTGDHVIRFEGAESLELDTSYRHGGRIALLLANPDSLILRHFRPPADLGGSEVTFDVVNMVPGGELVIEIGRAVTAAEMRFGDERTVGLNAGAYAIAATDAAGAERVELGTVDLDADHSFLVITPDPAGGLAGGTIVF